MSTSTQRFVFILLALGGCFCWFTTTERTASHDGKLTFLRNYGSDTASSYPRRNLQQRLISTTLNALVGVVTPAISERVQFVVVTYYNYYNFDEDFGYETNPHVVGDVSWTRSTTTTAAGREESDFTTPFVNATSANTTTIAAAASEAEAVLSDASDSTTFCEEEAQVDYKLQSLDGIGAISLDSISFVDNSQNIRLRFQNRQAGAVWSGKWQVRAKFPTLTAVTTARLTTEHSKADNNEIDSSGGIPNCARKLNDGEIQPAQSVNGTLRFFDVTVDTLVQVHGETDRLVLFAGTSSFASANIERFSYNYASVDVSDAGTLVLSDAEQGGETVDVATYLLEGGDEKLMIDSYLEALMTEALQGMIDYYLPRPLLP